MLSIDLYFKVRWDVAIILRFYFSFQVVIFQVILLLSLKYFPPIIYQYSEEVFDVKLSSLILNP